MPLQGALHALHGDGPVPTGGPGGKVVSWAEANAEAKAKPMPSGVFGTYHR